LSKSGLIDGKPVFIKAIAKHGEGAFSIEHVACALTIDFLAELESIIIAQDGTMLPAGYNMTSGGEGLINPVPEVCEKISRAHKGKAISIEQRAKISDALKGRKRPDHVVEKLRDGRTSYVASEETRKKISEANKGRAVSQETRKKMSENNAKTQLGRPLSAETKTKLSLVRTGKKPTDETRKRMSEAHLGRRHSAESIAKISANAKDRFARFSAKQEVTLAGDYLANLELHAAQSGIF